MTEGILSSFLNLFLQKSANLSKSMIGDSMYEPKNNFKFPKKKAILAYLKQECLIITQQLARQKPKKYTNYNVGIVYEDIKSISILRQLILKIKSHIDAAQDKLCQIQFFNDELKINFLNEAAFQFDRQRYISMVWGLIIGSIINSVVYTNGSIPRRAALFLSISHFMGQISYHHNLERYFDSVYSIFQRQTLKYIAEQKQLENLEKKI